MNKAHFLSKIFVTCCVHCSTCLNRTSHKQKIFEHLWFCTIKCQIKVESDTSAFSSKICSHLYFKIRGQVNSTYDGILH